MKGEIREGAFLLLTLVIPALEGSLRLGFFFLTSSSSSNRYWEGKSERNTNERKTRRASGVLKVSSRSPTPAIRKKKLIMSLSDTICLRGYTVAPGNMDTLFFHSAAGWMKITQLKPKPLFLFILCFLVVVPPFVPAKQRNVQYKCIYLFLDMVYSFLLFVFKHSLKWKTERRLNLSDRLS